MDGLLRALFLEKGFTELQLDEIEARDLELRHLGDLAAGASSEEDARAWADELGLSSRVSKSRFVRSWMEAREGLQATTPATPAKMGHVAEAKPAKYVEEVIEEDREWVKVTETVESRVVLSIDGEPGSTAGGFSDPLRSSLRANGLTSIEVSQLEQTLEPRSCRALAVAANSFEGAMRLARLCGIQSKVSQENFAKTWHQAAASMGALDGFKSSKSQKLSDLVKEENWEACTRVLMQRSKVAQAKDLLPMLAGLVQHLAEKDRLKASKPEVLPALVSLYGPEALAAAEKTTAVAQAEWRYAWLVRSFFNWRTLRSLQAEVLSAYDADEFQAKCKALNESIEPLSLDRKMQAIEALCLEHALKRILPLYGFKPDAEGLSEMKQVLQMATEPEVKRRQMLITAAVMKQFKL